jgi:hypothetical protein
MASRAASAAEFYSTRPLTRLGSPIANRTRRSKKILSLPRAPCYAAAHFAWTKELSMKRRPFLLLASLGIMAAIAVLGMQRESTDKLLVLQWASKAATETPLPAIVIEMGLKDTKAQPWSGKAVVTGADVVHREGYRFRTGDKLVERDGWVASSHRALMAPAGRPAATFDRFASVGVVLHLSGVKSDASLALTIDEQKINVKVPLKDVLAGKPHAIEEGHAVVRLITTATPIETGKTEDDFPAACYGPDGTLWVAYTSYTNREENRRIEAPQLKEQPKDFKSFYTPDFADQLLVRSYKDGKWSEPIAITKAKEDLFRCAIAAEGNGTVWVTYSANREGKFHLFARSISTKADPDGKTKDTRQVGAEQQLTTRASRNLSPVMSTDQNGQVWVACQSWDDTGSARITTLTLGKGKWEQTKGVNPVTKGAFHFWHAALAAGPAGQITAAYDSYLGDDYDVHCYDVAGSKGVLPLTDVAVSSRFEARPSLAYDARGRLWIAYEEGPEQWGKNFGALDHSGGQPLYFARTVRVVCLVDGKLMKPVAELPPLGKGEDSSDTPQKAEAMPRYAYPQIGIDGKGRVWLTYRQKFGNRYTTHPGSYWLTMARRLDGDKWSEPIEVSHSDGLLDSRPVMLPHASGGLRIIHNTDGRYTTPETIDNQVFMSYVDLPGDPVEPKLEATDAGKKDAKLVEQTKAENEAVKRCREYRIEAGGKKYQLLRGEFHRHTEISWDGGPDGSLEDMWRYAIDVAALDWIGNADHDNGAGREYPWWLTQKTTDAYNVKERFTPMYTYERSVAYPHGHRNCMFAQRGVRTLPRLAQPDMDKRVAGIHADDTKMLYRYLKAFDGICASHTSATSMGTDWRDNDPAVEPVVEIYQGDRMSYEKEAGPRAGFDPKSGKKPANIAGWYPDGFINHALDKGYRLSFQASSDHWSTHISYCIVLAEKHDRAGILAALKKRHSYAATDNIIVDVHSGDHIMGDEFKAQEATLDIKVIGTSKLAKVDVLKDAAVVHTFEPGKSEFQEKWTDPKPSSGTHYYYVRVQQADGELAWGSPMWIELAK